LAMSAVKLPDTVRLFPSTMSADASTRLTTRSDKWVMSGVEVDVGLAVSVGVMVGVAVEVGKKGAMQNDSNTGVVDKSTGAAIAQRISRYAPVAKYEPSALR